MDIWSRVKVVLSLFTVLGVTQLEPLVVFKMEDHYNIKDCFEVWLEVLEIYANLRVAFIRESLEAHNFLEVIV